MYSALCQVFSWWNDWQWRLMILAYLIWNVQKCYPVVYLMMLCTLVIIGYWFNHGLIYLVQSIKCCWLHTMMTLISGFRKALACWPVNSHIPSWHQLIYNLELFLFYDKIFHLGSCETTKPIWNHRRPSSITPKQILA